MNADGKKHVGEGKKVGTIQLVDWPQSTQYSSLGSLTKSKQNLNQQPNLSLIRPSPNLSTYPENTNITAENKLRVRIKLTRSVLTANDFFLLVIRVLVDAAELGASRIFWDYTSPIVGTGVYIIFKEPVPARTRPPFFGAKWLIQTMAALPEYMAKKGVFQEADLLVNIGGVGVADGFLMRASWQFES